MEGGQWRRRQREKVEVQEKGRRWVYCSLIDSFFFFFKPPHPAQARVLPPHGWEDWQQTPTPDYRGCRLH